MAAAVAGTLVERGFDVVVTHPLSEADFEYLAAELSALGTDVYAATLSPSLEVALSDRGDRELDEWERDRVRELYDRGIHRPDFGFRIDNAGESPAETVDGILQRIRAAEPVVAAGERRDSVEHENVWD